MLITKENITIPDGIYTLAFVLRDNGLYISRERIYTLTFNLTHRFEEEKFLLTTSSIPFLMKQKSFLTKLFLQNFQWRFLILLIVSWLILVFIALWTCYRYDQISKIKQKEQQEQFEIQVRQHAIISPPIPILPKSSLLPINSQQLYDKETLTPQDDDEVEDTSYDADHIITDANFVLTSGCTTNESNLRYVSSSFLSSERIQSIHQSTIKERKYKNKKTAFDFLSFFPVFISI